MKQDIMIYLGPRWGQTVLLSKLENIIQISEQRRGSSASAKVVLTVTTADRIAEDDIIVPFKFSSQSLTPEEADEERKRLLGFSNGILRAEDIARIADDIKAQTDRDLELTLTEPAYDISFVRKMMADMEQKPYYRFVLQYNPEQDNIEVFDAYNDHIIPVIEQWADEKFIRNLDMDEKSLAFAYEAIHRLTEEFIVAADALSGDEGDKLPVMNLGGRGSREVVDLGKM